MATVGELRERLRRPLERELATGCRDDVVVGGLERLVTTVGRPFADVRALLAGYAGLPPVERAARLEAALRQLGPEPVRASAATASAEPDAPPAAIAAATFADADALLDAPLSERAVDLGAQAARKLAEVGLTTYRDVLTHAPRRWEDRRALPSFAAVHGLERATVVGTVVGRKLVPTRKGDRRLEAA